MATERMAPKTENILFVFVSISGAKSVGFYLTSL